MSRTLPLPATHAAPVRAPAPIVFGGEVHLGQLRGNDFIVRRTTDWATLTHVPLGNPAAIGALSDGSLVALDATDRMGRASLLIRVAPGARRPTLHDGLVPETGALRICAARDADEFACTRPGGDRVYRLKLVEGGLELVTAARLRGDRCRIMTSLADGSIVYASGPRELVRAAFGTLPRRYAVSIEPHTLLPGPGRDLLWVVGADELQLCSLAEPMRPLARRQVDVDQIDIAAGGRYLAVLLLDRAASAPGRRWSLVCLDARGTERWHRPIAAASLRSDRWVACSGRHIAVAGDGELDVFDARTGALVHTS